MNWRMALTLSLGANLVLAGFVAREWAHHRPPDPPLAMPVRSAPLPEPVAPEPARPTSVEPASRIVPFHWRYIETNDFRQYIANLRAVECPERLIRDLVADDLDRHFSSLERAGRAHPRAPWDDLRSNRVDNLRQGRDELDRKIEHHRLCHELLGADWLPAALQIWNAPRDEGVIAGLLLGNLDGATAGESGGMLIGWIVRWRVVSGNSVRLKPDVVVFPSFGSTDWSPACDIAAASRVKVSSSTKLLVTQGSCVVRILFHSAVAAL